MASIEKRSRQDGRASWRAHYRTPSGEQRNKTFNRKAEAERFLASVESSKNTGSFVDSVLARITVGDWATHWLDNQTHLKPSTHERYAGIIREHIRPKWDRVKLANVSHADVQKWVPVTAGPIPVARSAADDRSVPSTHLIPIARWRPRAPHGSHRRSDSRLNERPGLSSAAPLEPASAGSDRRRGVPESAPDTA